MIFLLEEFLQPRNPENQLLALSETSVYPNALLGWTGGCTWLPREVVQPPCLRRLRGRGLQL